ncbi:MAG: antibiotic biosynthesis monooxygenase [Christiangramia sp.]|nr:antibiotic biosynthesis monooxygenase [Christiangramia sp.]
MKKYGLLATVKVKSGNEKDVAYFISSAVELPNNENKTTWFCFRLDLNSFGIFGRFEDEEGRSNHLNGEKTKQLMEYASKLLSEGP